MDQDHCECPEEATSRATPSERTVVKRQQATAQSQATATSPAPPKGLLPAVKRPTPTVRRSRWLVSTTSPGALDTPTVELTI